MEGINNKELEYLDNAASIIIGFSPNNIEFHKIIKLQKELFEYITDNPIFTGLEISTKFKFYSGINWFDNYCNESDTDDSNDKNNIII
jgi:hypothetical protein